MAAFHPVHSTSRNHFALAIDDQVNFFGCLMMMRKVGASRRKVHQEEAHHNVGLIDGIAGSGVRPSQKFVQNRCRMTFHGLLLKLIHIHDLRF